MSRNVRKGVTVLVLAMGLGLTGCAASGQASCAAPVVTVSSAEITAGGQVTVSADSLWAECRDTGDGVSAPAADVELRLVYLDDGSVSLPLGTADANSDGTLSQTVTIPADAPSGAAELWVGDSSVPVTVS